ncbi:unnamed protein product [Heligmosomoides polygyrus]|uniref:GPI ethanolamine phosphate transferase 1 n=1 Tax=Heligmosomoides polygyrus TaxID=6339 RepID=A0A183FVN7_HELPZ|nr:unnamed protein product [Heligmosomoides polygyrus]
MPWRLACAGVLIHAVLIYSIFDIYYTSPIVTDVPAHEFTTKEAPAKRLVVFTADGLRLDSFSRHAEKSPFLHSIIRERKGIYAISQSHVPTESRPGHVAIFAGFTEDVSAVARGWKANPVEFDSIFNRSKESWMWGSPDIVTLFDSAPHVHSFMYSPDDEDFGTSDAYKLDEWVFKRVEEFFEERKNDAAERERLNSSRLVFFLHLLGLDTNGHGNKPHSKEYLDNIEVVDRGIRRMQHVFNNFFNDQSTSWVFTADHGMTDWGSHGAGTDDEVLTPFVAWGAGVQKGGPTFQVDITPLLASLIGIAVPVNSMGVLPVQVLDVTQNYLFKSSLANFLQLKEQFLVLRAEKAKRLWFKDSDTFGLVALERCVATRHVSLFRRFAAASSLFIQNAPHIRKAIFHYHRYDRSFLGGAISCCFIAWISLVWCYLTRCAISFNFISPCLIASTMVFCWYCTLPLTNWLYLLLPLLLLSVIENSMDLTTTVYRFVCHVFANYSTVSFTFLLQPKNAWRLFCIVLFPFPFFANVGTFETPWLCVSAPLILALLLRKLSGHPLMLKKSTDFNKLSALLFITAGLILVSSYVFQKVCSVVGIPALCLLLMCYHFVDSVYTVSGSLFVPYSLLSIAYESMFTLCFIPLLALFLRFEFGHLSDDEFAHLPASQTLNTKITGAELRRAVICVSFVLATLFGTGNFASMNSFNPSTLSRFISVFSPFTMAALLILKLFIPLLMISLVFAAVLRFNHEAIQRLSCLVLIITDLMAMCFFHHLKDDGSWLDIGLSISQYLISMCMSVAVLLLLLCARHLMTVSLSRHDIIHVKNLLKRDKHDCLL